MSSLNMAAIYRTNPNLTNCTVTLHPTNIGNIMIANMKEEENKMAYVDKSKKHYYIMENAQLYETEDAAEKAAKRLVTAKNHGINEVVIYASMARVAAPVPEAEVTKYE